MVGTILRQKGMECITLAMWGKFLCILMNLSIISLCDSYLQVSMLSTTHPRGC